MNSSLTRGNIQTATRTNQPKEYDCGYQRKEKGKQKERKLIHRPSGIGELPSLIMELLPCSVSFVRFFYKDVKDFPFSPSGYLTAFVMLYI